MKFTAVVIDEEITEKVKGIHKVNNRYKGRLG